MGWNDRKSHFLNLITLFEPQCLSPSGHEHQETLNLILPLIPNHPRISFIFCHSFHLNFNIIHSLYRDPSKGARRGHGGGKDRWTYRNPLFAPSLPYLNLKHIQTEFRGFAFAKMVQFHADFNPTVKFRYGFLLLNIWPEKSVLGVEKIELII